MRLVRDVVRGRVPFVRRECPSERVLRLDTIADTRTLGHVRRECPSERVLRLRGAFLDDRVVSVRRECPSERVLRLAPIGGVASGVPCPKRVPIRERVGGVLTDYAAITKKRNESVD